MKRIVNLALLLGLLTAAPAVKAQSEKPIRIGVLSDLGGAFADVSGPGSVLAAKMAAEDYRARHPGRPVEVISGDHQNKADIGSTIARRWTDTEGVDLIIDVPNSAVALAVSEIVKARNRTFLVTGGVSSALTGTQCSPNTVHYSLDTWTMANVPTQALVAQGGKTWYYVTADYAFGHDMQRQSTKALEKAGGKVAGSVNYPSSTMDYSSFLLQAQASNADVIALAAANGDFVNAMKQAVEFNLMGGKQKVVGLAVYISDIISLTSRVAKGAVVTNNWYWDLNDQTRAFSARFAKRHNGKVPTDLQAGAYAAVTNFLAAADEVGASSDGRAVVAKMKSRPNHDPLYGESTIRQDGRRMTPVYVWTVKDPTPGKTYDLFAPLRTVPVSEAYRPLAEGGCSLVTAAN